MIVPWLIVAWRLPVGLVGRRCLSGGVGARLACRRMGDLAACTVVRVIGMVQGRAMSAPRSRDGEQNRDQSLFQDPAHAASKAGLAALVKRVTRAGRSDIAEARAHS
jgi:hypothetical protein